MLLREMSCAAPRLWCSCEVIQRESERCGVVLMMDMDDTTNVLTVGDLFDESTLDRGEPQRWPGTTIGHRAQRRKSFGRGCALVPTDARLVLTVMIAATS